MPEIDSLSVVPYKLVPTSRFSTSLGWALCLGLVMNPVQRTSKCSCCKSLQLWQSTHSSKRHVNSPVPKKADSKQYLSFFSYLFFQSYNSLVEPVICQPYTVLIYCAPCYNYQHILSVFKHHQCGPTLHIRWAEVQALKSMISEYYGMQIVRHVSRLLTRRITLCKSENSCKRMAKVV